MFWAEPSWFVTVYVLGPHINGLETAVAAESDAGDPCGADGAGDADRAAARDAQQQDALR